MCWYCLLVISFGPAHPAAHGVFRLLLILSGEVCFACNCYLGLLFRTTELLSEYRSMELISGYFARLDYVSFFILEFGLYEPTLIKNTFSNFNWDILLLNNGIANNLLNISCLLVDTGLISSLL